MDAEAWLKKHCKPDDWHSLTECLCDALWTNNVIRYMEAYSEYKHGLLMEKIERIHKFVKQASDQKKG